MATLSISLRKEQQVKVEGEVIKDEKILKGYQVYANVDSLSCWIGSCTDFNSLKEIAGEEELITSIEESASEVEYECLIATLKHNNYKYNFFGEIKTAKEIR